MVEPSTPEQSPQEEVAELERLLAEKKQALAVEGRAPDEREAFGEVFRERHGEALLPPLGAAPPLPQKTLPPDELAQHSSVLKTQDRETQLETLVGIALTKGVIAAAEIARHATPWLLDELHDRLQDRYYDQLLRANKLKAL
ncbi:MAG: hypothetical protein AAB591_00990 [Patescibacteria group bacterium]